MICCSICIYFSSSSVYLKLAAISVLWPIEVLVKGPYNIDNGSSEHSARGHKPNPPVIGVAATSRL